MSLPFSAIGLLVDSFLDGGGAVGVRASAGKETPPKDTVWPKLGVLLGDVLLAIPAQIRSWPSLPMNEGAEFGCSSVAKGL